MKKTIWIGLAVILLTGCERTARQAKVLVPADKLAMLIAKRNEKAEEAKRYDKPAEAMRFLVHMRTEPGMLTRGPRSNDPNDRRTLPSDKYLQAVLKARSNNRFDSSNGVILPPENSFGLRAAPGAALGSWNPLGPSNQGGRTRAFLVDPVNPSIMYAGSVGGGVFKSTNAGASWTQLTDLAIPNIAVTSLSFEPGNSQVIYAGTGEGFFNADAIRGLGIFKSTNGGATWSQLASTNNSNFYYVNDIVVSPRSKQRLFAATLTGVFRSNDGGATWAQMVNGSAANGCTDLALQVNRAVGYLFASCGNFTQGTIYRALDSPAGAVSAVHAPTGAGRLSLAIAPSNEAYVYAMGASIEPNQYSDGLRAVYRSTANGASGTWTTQVDNTNPNTLNTLLLTNPVYAFPACVGGSAGLYNQGWYDNVIAVDPVDPNTVWTGGIDLFKSTDGGANWGIASYWWFGQGDPNYAHADQHAIVFHPQYNGSTNKTMFVANDGGIFRTTDARAGVGTTLASVCGAPPLNMTQWTELNNGYETMQFYYGSAYPDGGAYFGGTQDNGTWRGTTASSAWVNLLGGDGGATAVDIKGDVNPANDVLFGEYTGLSIQKSTNGGLNFFDAITGITDPGFAFIAPFTMRPTATAELWTGGWYIWRTVNQAASWTRASAITAGNGSVSASAVSTLNGNNVLIGMSDGYIHYNTGALSTDSNTNWPFSRPRTAAVTGVAFDPNNLNVGYATFGTFSGTSVYKTINAGVSWTAIAGTGANVVPAVPANCIVVDPADSQRLYLGTDVGIFTSIDGGLNWYKEVNNFANVAVRWLEINQTGTKRLFAFTHGRGAWRVDLNP